MAKLTMYHGSSNFGSLDLYAAEAGESVDDNFASRSRIASASRPECGLAAGGYDIFITEFNSKDCSGPVRIDVVLGDIVDFAVVDTVDPAVLDLLFLSRRLPES